jgi:hypothetical protein
MDTDAVTCRYVFTMKEFNRAARCFCWHSAVVWVLAASMVPLAAVAILQDFGVIWNTSGKPQTAWDFICESLSAVFFLVALPAIFYFTSMWSFRRMPSYEQDMRYTLSAESINVKTALFEIKVFWEGVQRVVESKWGIVLLLKGKRSFHWFPKSGFENPEAVESFRALLRQHVADTKGLARN